MLCSYHLGKLGRLSINIKISSVQYYRSLTENYNSYYFVFVWLFVPHRTKKHTTQHCTSHIVQTSTPHNIARPKSYRQAQHTTLHVPHLTDKHTTLQCMPHILQTSTLHFNARPTSYRQAHYTAMHVPHLTETSTPHNITRPTSYIQAHCTTMHYQLTRVILHIASLTAYTTYIWKLALRGHLNTDWYPSKGSNSKPFHRENDAIDPSAGASQLFSQEEFAASIYQCS